MSNIKNNYSLKFLTRTHNGDALEDETNSSLSINHAFSNISGNYSCWGLNGIEQGTINDSLCMQVHCKLFFFP